MSEEKEKPTKVTHTTHIGSVTGQVHTGSGDIFVQGFSGEVTLSGKEDFLAALRELKQAVEATRAQGLPEDTADDTVTELEAAEEEVEKASPQADRIVKRLENAKAILTTGAGVATAATAAAAAASKLIPFIEAAIRAVSTIF